MAEATSPLVGRCAKERLAFMGICGTSSKPEWAKANVRGATPLSGSDVRVPQKTMEASPSIAQLMYGRSARHKL